MRAGKVVSNDAGCWQRRSMHHRWVVTFAKRPPGDSQVRVNGSKESATTGDRRYIIPKMIVRANATKPTQLSAVSSPERNLKNPKPKTSIPLLPKLLQMKFIHRI
jgi:hypothetical protein